MATLPASWYHSAPLYELERRAIFSKRWLQITHQNRFLKIGDYAQYEMAGYRFFIIKNRQGELQAFHNVCRHRAFPVLTKPEGNASIIACGYHGWSYGLNGKLAKAPGFRFGEDLAPEEYGLLSIHLHVDRQRFVWVNLEAQDKPSICWEEQCAGADTQERLNEFNMEGYVYDHSWNMEGHFNWKNLMDNYNECYHCSVAHPGIAATTDLANYGVETKGTFIAHFARPKPDFATANNSNVAPTYVFPSSSATINTVYLYLMRAVPLSANRTSMQYEVYRHTSCTDSEFEEMDGFMKQIENEDRVICERVQTNLNAEVYSVGPLHGNREKGVQYFQNLVKKAIFSHNEEEKNAGHEIWPARRVGPKGAMEDEQDFCMSLCWNTPKSELSW